MTTNLRKWTRPDNYFGAEWYGYYSAGVGKSRDSDCLERANFDATLAKLGGETGEDDDGISMVRVVRENHWAVGWVEWIAIHESNTEALAIASDIQEGLERYPFVSESLLSQYEEDESANIWERCYGVADRVRYLRKHSYTADSVAQLLRAVRGDWGEAASMLHCPSDILH